MAAKIISGAEIASSIREEIKTDAAKLKDKHNIVPGLVTIIVGKNPASVSYVTAKQKTAKELGFYSVQEDVDEAVPEAELLNLIDKYNSNPQI
ncbi:MAG TPA: tetrahydrofolate dehydrogenase/cyclohydrolase catalytic domain-containing protein, partial [Syntrophorhabdus sp.]|nr:tetrahydrofolate dehydrogenase/cyclohydrolase catalytic domain-containing protein [Syntrophorhabdus sp.]